MKKQPENGTFIHGVAASEHLDSSGERILIKGVDISSLTKDGCLNWEHKSDQASHIVGKILEAKKIFKKEDCDNEHHTYFWNKVKMPFIYIAGELFDHVGHSASQDVAAMLRYDKTLNKKETKNLINFSIEGSRLGKDGSNITNCIARKVTITIHPCNKMASAEQLDKPSKATKKMGGIDISKEILSKFKKSESIAIEILKGEMKYLKQLAPAKGISPRTSSARNFTGAKATAGEHREGKPIEPKRTFAQNAAPKDRKVGDRIAHTTKKPRTGHDIYNDPKTWESDKAEKSEKKSKKFYTSNVRKAITASCGMGAPSTQTQGASLQKEDLCKKKVYKNLSEESWKNYKYQTQLIEFISNKQPSLTKTEVLAIAKTYSYIEQTKQEKKLTEL